MGRKKYSSGDILIDLTSLLDVVFIVLLIILSDQQNREQKISEREDVLVQRENTVNQREESVNQREQEANTQYELYSDQLDMADNVYKYVMTISVNVEYVSQDMKERKVNVLLGGETEIEEFELKGNNTENLDKLDQRLNECIKNNNDRPIILSLNEDDEKILWRDERKIEEIFEKLDGTYDYVYEKKHLKK